GGTLVRPAPGGGSLSEMGVVLERQSANHRETRQSPSRDSPRESGDQRLRLPSRADRSEVPGGGWVHAWTSLLLIPLRTSPPGNSACGGCAGVQEHTAR